MIISRQAAKEKSKDFSKILILEEWSLKAKRRTAIQIREFLFLHMSRISGIIAFQTKKSNLERDLRKETGIKWVTKGNRKIPHSLPLQSFFFQQPSYFLYDVHAKTAPKVPSISLRNSAQNITIKRDYLPRSVSLFLYNLENEPL